MDPAELKTLPLHIRVRVSLPEVPRRPRPQEEAELIDAPSKRTRPVNPPTPLKQL